MNSDESFIYLISHTQSIILIALVVCLLFISIKTKLTHVDKFRQNFVAGIFIYFASAMTVIILSIWLLYILPEPIYNLLDISTIIGVIIAYFLIIRGLFILNSYLSSLIDYNEQNYKRISIIIAFLASGTIFITNLIILKFDPANMGLIIPFFGLGIGQFFIFIYCFFLHREIKVLKINMMAYFGTGFMFLTVHLSLSTLYNLGIIPYIIWFSIILGLCNNLMIIFLILGYLNFKNRIDKISSAN